MEANNDSSPNKQQNQPDPTQLETQRQLSEYRKQQQERYQEIQRQLEPENSNTERSSSSSSSNRSAGTTVADVNTLVDIRRNEEGEKQLEQLRLDEEYARKLMEDYEREDQQTQQLQHTPQPHHLNNPSSNNQQLSALDYSSRIPPVPSKIITPTPTQTQRNHNGNDTIISDTSPLSDEEYAKQLQEEEEEQQLNYTAHPSASNISSSSSGGLVSSLWNIGSQVPGFVYRTVFGDTNTTTNNPESDSSNSLDSQLSQQQQQQQPNYTDSNAVNSSSSSPQEPQQRRHRYNIYRDYHPPPLSPSSSSFSPPLPLSSSSPWPSPFHPPTANNMEDDDYFDLIPEGIEQDTEEPNHPYYSRHIQSIYGDGYSPSPDGGYQMHRGSSSSSPLRHLMPTLMALTPPQHPLLQLLSQLQQQQQQQQLLLQQQLHHQQQYQAFNSSYIVFPDTFLQFEGANQLPPHLQGMLRGEEPADYESLLQLGELLQPVSRGASAEQISTLPNRTYHRKTVSATGISTTTPANNNTTTTTTTTDTCTKDQQQEDIPKCGICLSEYEEGEELTTLPRCLHAFHKDCVEKWLGINKICPVCREDIH